jgi:hypothetical protein
MKRIQVTVEGVSPILMNSPKAMFEEKGTTMKTKKYDWKEEAEKVSYRDKKGILYVPSEAIKGSMINAASYKKIGKFSLKPIIASAVRIEPLEISLGTKTYDIDLRTVVIQRKDRVIKARPKIEDWKINFTVVYNDEMITDTNIIKECLKEAGERVGILDFRPQKMGSFGMFKVTKFVEEK